MQSLTIVGNLVEDPMTSQTQSGKTVVNMRVAASNSFRNHETNEWEDKNLIFVQAALWEKQAEEFLRLGLGKGDKVRLEGPVVVETYVSKKTGEVTPSLKLERVKECWGTRRGTNGGDGQKQQQQRPQRQQQPQRQQNSAPQQNQGGDPWGGGQQSQNNDPWGGDKQPQGADSWGNDAASANDDPWG